LAPRKVKSEYGVSTSQKLGEKKTSKWVLPQIAEQKRCNWIMKMFPLIAIFDGFVHAPRQNTVSPSVFCCDATRQCKYQRFGLQHAKSIMQKASRKKHCK